MVSMSSGVLHQPCGVAERWGQNDEDEFPQHFPASIVLPASFCHSPRRRWSSGVLHQPFGLGHAKLARQ